MYLVGLYIIIRIMTRVWEWDIQLFIVSSFVFTLFWLLLMISLLREKHLHELLLV
jgi:hypothetical protein